MEKLSRKQLQEIAQEKGFKVLSYKTELLGIEQEIDGKKFIIPVSHNPARLSLEDYEESREIYKYRRVMMKFVEKHIKQGSKFWDSSRMGTYVKQTEDEVMQKYAELIKGRNVAEKLMEMDRELSKQTIKEN